MLSFLQQATLSVKGIELFYLTEERNVAAFSPEWVKTFLLTVGCGKTIYGKHINTILPEKTIDIVSKKLDEIQKTKVPSSVNIPQNEKLYVWTISPWEYNLETNKKQLGYCITQNERSYDRSIVLDKSNLKQKSIDFILESVYDGYWDWYIQEDYEYMSPRFWTMFGYDPKEKKMEPKEWMDIIFKEDLEKALQLFDAHIKSKGQIPYYLEARYRHKDGHVVYVICKGHVIKWNNDGTPNRMIGTHTDVTDLRNVQQENIKLQLEKEKIQEISELKTKLLATLSHEIRTPLHGMMGMASILESSSSDDANKKLATSLLDNCDLLLNVLNDALLMCKLDNFEDLPTHKEKANLKTLVTSVINLFMIKAKEKTNAITLQSKNNDSFENITYKSVIIDKNLLRQILNNLISNGIKFTSEGKINVSYWITDITIDNNSKHYGTIHFSVSDTGIGIKECNLFRIFDAFSQVEDEITRKYGGTGLGLTISKRIVENIFKGKISVTSTYGSGSVFSFYIPKCELIPKKKLPNQEVVQEILKPQPKIVWEKDYFEKYSNKCNPISVLIVDDNKLNRTILKKILNAFKNIVGSSSIKSIDEAENGQLALDKCLKNKYSVIFMDLHMPVMDGFEASKKIRNFEDKNVKKCDASLIVAVTADAFLDTKNNCIECGMDLFISKPFKKEKIFLLLSERCIDKF